MKKFFCFRSRQNITDVSLASYLSHQRSQNQIRYSGFLRPHACVWVYAKICSDKVNKDKSLQRTPQKSSWFSPHMPNISNKKRRHQYPHLVPMFSLSITYLAKTFSRAVNQIPVLISSLYRNFVDLALMSLDRDVPKLDFDSIERLDWNRTRWNAIVK